jgi:hypothetical protein
MKGKNMRTLKIIENCDDNEDNMKAGAQYEEQA